MFGSLWVFLVISAIVMTVLIFYAEAETTPAAAANEGRRPEGPRAAGVSRAGDVNPPKAGR